MPSYDEAAATSTDRSPFSNGDEWETWAFAWCLRPGAPCRHDRQLRTGESGVDCPLIDVALLNKRTPAEWGERTSALGREMYTCTKYEAE